MQPMPSEDCNTRRWAPGQPGCCTHGLPAEWAPTDAAPWPPLRPEAPSEPGQGSRGCARAAAHRRGWQPGQTRPQWLLQLSPAVVPSAQSAPSDPAEAGPLQRGSKLKQGLLWEWPQVHAGRPHLPVVAQACRAAAELHSVASRPSRLRCSTSLPHSAAAICSTPAITRLLLLSGLLKARDCSRLRHSRACCSRPAAGADAATGRIVGAAGMRSPSSDGSLSDCTAASALLAAALVTRLPNASVAAGGLLPPPRCRRRSCSSFVARLGTAAGWGQGCAGSAGWEAMRERQVSTREWCSPTATASCLAAVLKASSPPKAACCACHSGCCCGPRLPSTATARVSSIRCLHRAAPAISASPWTLEAGI